AIGEHLQNSTRGRRQVQHPKAPANEVKSLEDLFQLERRSRPQPLALGLGEEVILGSVWLAHCAPAHYHRAARLDQRGESMGSRSTKVAVGLSVLAAGGAAGCLFSAPPR